ncbi:MAG TPA: hypothetical protein EYP71_01730 [Dehalococcoidia bacterium]|nr:hypothetical protein [Dehalococcoidia bacterium]
MPYNHLRERGGVADLPDRCYDELPLLVGELRAQYPGADIEVWCLGEDRAGRPGVESGFLGCNVL